MPQMKMALPMAKIFNFQHYNLKFHKNEEN